VSIPFFIDERVERVERAEKVEPAGSLNLLN